VLLGGLCLVGVFSVFGVFFFFFFLGEQMESARDEGITSRTLIINFIDTCTTMQ